MYQDSAAIAPAINIQATINDTTKQVSVNNPVFAKQSILKPIKKNHPFKDSSYLEEFKTNDVNFLNKINTYYSKEYKSLPVFTNDTSQKQNIEIKPVLKKEFKVSNIEPIKDVTILSMLVMISIFAWIRVFFGKFLNQLFLSTINYHESARLFRSNNALMLRLYYILNFISFIILGLYISLLLTRYEVQIIWLSKELIIFFGPTIMILYYLYKSFSSRIFGFLFQKSQLTEEVNHSSLLYIKIISIILLPLVSIIFFVGLTLQNIIIWTSILMFVSCIVLIIYRSIKIFVSKGFSFFYTMLYLCIVEILPILFAYKLIIK